MLRFWNNDILTNAEGVLDTIVRLLEAIAQQPLFRGAGEGLICLVWFVEEQRA